MNYIFIVACINLMFTLGYGSRVFEKMYEDIQSNMACFKRFNGTHEIGCTSDFWGNVGIIHLIQDVTNLSWVIEEGPHAPYVLAIVPELFTAENIKLASESGKLAGIVLFGSDKYTTPSNFTGEKTCPNSGSSLYLNTSFSDYCKHTPWNPAGSSLLYMSWNFPIFLLDDDKSIDNIISCYNKFNKPINGEAREWPLCAIELHSNMYAATSSEVCIRRSQGIFTLVELCEPLEDLNIWGSMFPFNISNPIEDQSVYIISTSADAASQFDNISPGANAAITGLVTLLVTAEALFRHRENIEFNGKNILFTIFEGEAWDYIGSSRMVYDMFNNQFPYKSIEGQIDQMQQLNLSQIGSIIDIKQTGLPLINKYEKKVLFLHTDPISNSDEEISIATKDLVDILVKTTKDRDIEFNMTLDETPLPPSSFQSFLKKGSIPGVMIADHNHEYNNKYYMSIYDNVANVNYKSFQNGTDDTDALHKDISDIASVLSSSLYTILTGDEIKINASETLTNELLYCFLVNMNCTYFQENSDVALRQFLKPFPATTFVSVKRSENPLGVLVLRILSRYLGEEVELEETECKSNNTQLMSFVYYPYVENGTCFKTSVHYSSALSPAFTIKDYDWESNEYSTWTESKWLKIAARIFLRPSPSEEIGLIIGGIISIFLSNLIVYFLNSKANIIFDFEVTPTPC